MDPQSQSFTPYSHTASTTSSSNDNWRLQNDVVRIQQIQAEHADRIARLERRQEDDARMKSVWGNSSPFPSVLSGTPQHAPLQQPSSDHFRNFDDEATTLMSSLHLDAEDEPRRGMGAASRANSVRFDESANQNHFSHSSRPSVDFLSRTSSGLGGLQMNERTSSHKSDGRASSAHSMRSLASGRANSLNLDTTYGLGEAHRSPLDAPDLAPGLLLLGAVPAIIRCWMNTNFKHDALLYAAICTGSYKSFLDVRLIQRLGFEAQIRTTEGGPRMVELPVYFPEAVPHPASSRSGSPAPQLPSIVVDFRVVESGDSNEEGKAIQIFLGSDVLRAHNADVLFSSNSMTLFDSERNKLSIPLARPENEASFNTLFIASDRLQTQPQTEKPAEAAKEQPFLNGLGQGSSTGSLSSAAASPPFGKYRPPGIQAAGAANADPAKPGATGSDKESRPPSRQSTASRPSLSLLNTRQQSEEHAAETTNQSAPLRSGSSPAIWGNWRRDNVSSTSGTQSAGLDWAAASKSRETSYQRKDTGIKVLKPKTPTTRTFSSSTTTGSSTASPADGRSRFFDEGRRRSITENKTPITAIKENVPSATIGSAASSSTGSTSATAAPAAPKTKSNPIGGASAFSWLNSSGGTK